MKFDVKQFIGEQFWKRFFIMFFGILLMGAFLSILRLIGWGLDPYTFQNDIVRRRIGWTLGNWNLLFNAALFVFVIIFNRKLIGLGTLVNWVMIGYSMDFFTWVWNKLPAFLQLFSDERFLWAKICIFILSILGFVISASFYMNADMGLSPYDAFAYILGHAIKKIPFFITRICYDLLAIVVGLAVAFGTDIPTSPAWISSVIMAFLLGPTIQIVGNFMNKYVLKLQKTQAC